MWNKHILFLILILSTPVLFAQRPPIVIGQISKGTGTYEITGAVHDSETGEALIGVTIYLPKQERGAVTDSEGEYKLILNGGLHDLIVSYTGFEKKVRKINVLGSGRMDIKLDVDITHLAEVVVVSESETRGINKEVGIEAISIERIKSIPNLGGEPDIIRSFTLLPGVSSTGEVSGGINVRGGGFDQNLILADGATVYNPNHLFGFVSAFNPSIVRSAKLYKGAIPSYFGGRGSSVMDISYQRSNLREWSSDVTLGMMSTKVRTGGPIVKDRVALNMSGRMSHVNWLFNAAQDGEINNSRAGFYDTNLILSSALNADNDLDYSLYRSEDSFQFASNNAISWGNMVQSIGWRSVISPKLRIELNAAQSLYRSTITEQSSFAGFEVRTGINEHAITSKVAYSLSSKSEITFGNQTKWYRMKLGRLIPSKYSSYSAEKIQPENGIETGLFLQHDFQITKNLEASYGLRFSQFTLKGPAVINEYGQGIPKSITSITGQTLFENNEKIQTYNGVEPRGGLTYNLSESSSVKLGFHRIYQYIHLISNTASISPINIWKLSDPFIQPARVDQVSAGYFKEWHGGVYEFSVEGYKKHINNVIDYKDGADLFLNSSLETELLSGKGKAYGVEILAKKNRGRLNGWVSYSYSRSLRKIEGQFESEHINDGRWYSSGFDKPHNFSLVNNYRLGPHVVMSYIFTYSTGQPVTLPQGKIRVANTVLGYFTERNGDRIPDYHRLDLALNFQWPSKYKVLSGTWTLAVYNLYGRNNPYSVFFKDTIDGPPQALQLTIVGSAFPTLSYEFSF